MNWFNQGFVVASPNLSLGEALAVMDKGAPCLVVLEDGRFRGLSCPLQISQALLKGYSPASAVIVAIDDRAIALNRSSELQQIKNQTVIDPAQCWQFMGQNHLKYLPLLKDDRTLIGVITEQNLLQQLVFCGQTPAPLLKCANHDRQLQESVHLEKKSSNADSQREHPAITPEYCYQVIQSQREFVLCSLPDTTILFANNAFTQILGYKSAELIGKQWAEIVPPDELDILLQKIANLSPQNPTFDNTNALYYEGNLIGMTQWHSRGIFDELGNLVQIQSIGRDITSLHQAEFQLQRTANRFRSLIENSNDVTVILDSESIFTYASPSTFQIAGYIPTEVEGHNILEFIHPDHHKLIVDTIQKAIARPFVALPSVEFLVLHKNGEWRWFEAVLTNLLDDMNVGGIVANCGDIHDRIQANQQLEARERLIENLTANLPIILVRYTLNADGTDSLDYISEGCERLYGIPAQVAITENHKVWECISEEYVARINQSILHSAQTLTTWHDEWEVTPPAGDRKWLAGFGTPTRNPDGGTTWDIISLDITQLKLTDIALQQSNSMLRHIFNNIPVAVYRVEQKPSDRPYLVYCSDNFAEMLDMSDFTLPMEINEVLNNVHPRDREILQQALTATAQELNPYYQEFRIISNQAISRWLSVHAIPTLHRYGTISWDGIVQDITQRKLSTIALEEANTQLELVVKSTNIGFYLTDLETGKSYVSDPYKAQLGYPPSSESGVPREWRDRLHPDDRARAISKFEAFMGGECDYNIDFRLRHRDGSYRWISSTAKLIRNAQGKPIKVVGSHIDITERKLSEERIRQSEYRFRKVFEQSTHGFVIVDTDQNIQEVNVAFMLMLGYAAHQIIGVDYQNLIYQDDREFSEQLYQRAITNPQRHSYSVIKRFVRAKGELLWANVSVVIVRDETGALQNTIRLIEDITPFREAQQIIERSNSELEELVKARTSALEASQAMLTQALEKNEILFRITEKIRASVRINEVLQCAVDEVREVLKVDRVLVYHFLSDAEGGMVMAESVRDGLDRLMFREFPPEVFPVECHHQFLRGKVAVTEDCDRSSISPCMKDFMKSLNVSAHITLGIVQSDHTSTSLWGTLIIHSTEPRQWQSWELEFVQQLSSPLALALTQSVLYQKLSGELEIRRDKEKELQAINNSLLYANRAKDQFLANMSHELRTPLNAILGLAEGLVQGVYGGLSNQQKHYLTTIERSGQHLLALINDILDLAKISAGTMEVSMIPFAVNSLCRASLMMVRQQALPKGLKLHSQIAVGLETIVGDELRLRQLLINLLSNAVKFSHPEGKVELIVDEYYKNEQRYVSFTVCDEGIGIAPENLAKLFQPFSQVDSDLSRRYTGTGLGLALVKQIAELHQAEVSVSSHLGRGSTFTVSLPQPMVQPTLDTPDAPRLPEVAASAPITSRKILLAEDNPDNVETIQDYLIALNYEVIVAANGYEVLSIIKEVQPDLILMDVQMPDMDGIETTRRLRAMAEYQNLPIVMLTALSMSGDQERCLGVGANVYLSKPYNLQKLSREVEKIITARSQSR